MKNPIIVLSSIQEENRWFRRRTGLRPLKGIIMSETEIQLSGHGRCLARHIESGKTVETATPPERGGSEDSFSSTDLVAGALGSCIATSIEVVAFREGIPGSEISVRVVKTLSDKPRRIGSLQVVMTVARPLSVEQRRKILAVAKTCPVHRSLHPDIGIEFILEGDEE